MLLPVLSFAAQTDRNIGLQFTGERLIAARSNQVACYRLHQGTLQHTWTNQDVKGTNAFAVGGRLLAVASSDGTVRIASTQTGQIKGVFKLDKVRKLAIDPADKRLALAGPNSVVIRDLSTGKSRSVKVPEMPINIALSQDSRTVAISYLAGRVELRSANDLGVLSAHVYDGPAFAITPNHRGWLLGLRTGYFSIKGNDLPGVQRSLFGDASALILGLWEERPILAFSYRLGHLPNQSTPEVQWIVARKGHQTLFKKPCDGSGLAVDDRAGVDLLSHG